MAQHFTVRNSQEVDEQLQVIYSNAAKSYQWVKEHTASPFDFFHSLKFDPVGFHPVGGHALNVIEQVNQTATYVVALKAAKLLFDFHPEVSGFVVAPGAHKSHDLDIMSEEEQFIGCETFAAVHPSNNQKLKKDMDKLASRTDRYRYVFFSSPQYDATERRVEMERDGIQVWSIALAGSAE